MSRRRLYLGMRDHRGMVGLKVACAVLAIVVGLLCGWLLLILAGLSS